MSHYLAVTARRDLIAARDRCRDIGERELAVRFLEEFDAVVQRIEMFPFGAPPVEGWPGVRRARMRRFPYGVFYRLADGEPQIARVLHAHGDHRGAMPVHDVG